VKPEYPNRLTDADGRDPDGGDSAGMAPSRRAVLRGAIAAGALGVTGLRAVGTASAQQGGVAYLKSRYLRGTNNPNEPRFRIVERCGTVDANVPCDGVGDRTYAAYAIRCPNYSGGDGDGDGGDGDGEDGDGGGCSGCEDGGGGDGEDGGGGDGGGCVGGHGCGRRILVNPNRNVRTGGLHRFVAVRDCGNGYLRAAFRPA